MRAEYIIGVECLVFCLGYFIRDLKDLGAVSPSDGGEPSQVARHAAPKNSTRQPW